MRLIDADKLEPKFVHGRWDDTYVSEAELMNAPTIDAVPVVRCKDCKHFISFKGERAKVNTDKSGWCDINDDSVRADDYCSYGERRSE